jgi:hypothetical protein
MSSCWKCGRDLPEGQVECEEGCDGPESGGPKRTAPKETKFAIFIDLKDDVIEANKLEFSASQHRFLELMGKAVRESGFLKFVKREAK